MQDGRVEQKLTELGYTWRYVGQYKLDRIDWVEAEQNPARLTRKYNEQHMFDLAMTLEHSDVFAIVVCENVGAPFDELSGGLHRGKAARYNDMDVLSAYVIQESDPTRRACLPMILNRIEGMGATREDCFYWIADFLDHHPGQRAEVLCKNNQVQLDAFQRWRKLERVNERARRLGMGTVFSDKKFTQKMKEDIGRLQNDNTFVGVIEVLAITRHMEAQNPEDFVKEIRREGKTEAEAHHLIERRRKAFVQEEAQRKSEEVRTPKATPTKYMSRVNGLLKFRRNFSVAALQLAGIPVPQRPPSRAKVAKLIEQLTEVLEAFDVMITQDEKELEWRKPIPRGEAHSGHTSPPM